MGSDSTTRTAWTAWAPGRSVVAGVVALWAAAAVLAGTASYLARRLQPASPTLLDAFGPPALASGLWVVLTLTIALAVRRFPPLRLDDRVRVCPGAMAVHVVAALAVTFVLNAAFLLIAEPPIRRAFDAYWPEVARTGLANLHFNFGVYWAIVLLVCFGPRLRRTVADIPPGLPERTLTVRSGRSRVRVKVSDIRWIEGAGDYVCLHVPDARHLLSERLKRLEKRLDPKRFVRVHRSAIVNVGAVRELRHLGRGDYEVTLDDGSTVRVSRTRRSDLERALRTSEVADLEEPGR